MRTAHLAALLTAFASAAKALSVEIRGGALAGKLVILPVGDAIMRVHAGEAA